MNRHTHILPDTLSTRLLLVGILLLGLLGCLLTVTTGSASADSDTPTPAPCAALCTLTHNGVITGSGGNVG